MTRTIRPAYPKPLSITRRPRRGGAAAIHQIQLHATRGPTTLERQVAATENWFSNPAPFPQGNDHGSWGSAADFLLGPDYRSGGGIVIVQFGNWLKGFGSWSAGFGARGTAVEYGAAEFGVAIEIAQAPRQEHGKYMPGDSDQPFSDELVIAVAWLCEHINDELDKVGVQRVPPVHINGWSQQLSDGIPRGYIGHEELANGRKGGKSDPGRMWDWPAFMELLQHEPEPPPFVPIPRKLTRRQAAITAYVHGAVPVRFDGRYEIHEIKSRRRSR